jgi:hypothetical protein
LQIRRQAALPRLSAAAAKGTALLIGKLLRAAQGPDDLSLTDVVGTAANAGRMLTGVGGPGGAAVPA